MDNKETTAESSNTNRVQISDRSPSIINQMSFSPPPVPNHSADSHEMHQRHSKGFQKLNSHDPSPSATPVPNQNEYFANSSSPPLPGQPYYNYGSPPPPGPGGPPGYYGQQQPYYGGPPPPVGPQYPLIQQQELLLPPGYNRPLWKRLLIGPIYTPIFSYISALVMAGVLIYEFVKFHNLTGNVIETSPFNPMIGPSFQVKRFWLRGNCLVKIVF
jgi:hypothetical protein